MESSSSVPTYKHFNELFHANKYEIFKISESMEMPLKADLLDLYKKNAKMFDENFPKLKSDIHPEIVPIFLQYIKENLYYIYLNGNLTTKHSVMHYVNDSDIYQENSLYYASPELARLSWINYKITKLWYEKLLELGYYLK
jgi:hypothetical protein